VSTPIAALRPASAADRRRPLPPISAASGLPPARLYLALVAGSVAIGALSLLFPSTPSYDPWSWLIWGREIIHLDLHTTGGPTWKPLTVILTTIFALFGGAAPDLLLVVSRAGAVLAVALAFRIAWRIARPLVTESVGADAGRWTLLPVALAAAVAAASLVNSPSFITDNGLGYSEGLMTALVLLALDRHLDGARRQAFTVGFFAALDRPELWLLWVPYGLYLWGTDRGARRLVPGLFLLIPVLWFLPEYWGSGHLLRGVTRAHHPRSNSPAFTSCPFCTEFVHHAWPRVMLRVKAVGLAALAAAAWGLWRARSAPGAPGSAPGAPGSAPGAPRSVLRAPISAGARARLLLVVVGAVGWLWWIGVSVETQAGFSGNDRYLVLGSALVAISGGVGWGWAAAVAAGAIRRLGPRGMAGRLRPGVAGASLAGTALALAVGIGTPPWFGPSVVDLPATHRALVYQAHLRQDLSTAIRELGGPSRVLSCGTVMAEGFQVPMVAYDLGVRITRVQAPPTPPAGAPPGWLAPGPGPNVIFQTRDTSHAALLPLPAQIRAWERDGAHYAMRRVRTFYVFSSCGAPGARS
jgi:hypothetical protein